MPDHIFDSDTIFFYQIFLAVQVYTLFKLAKLEKSMEESYILESSFVDENTEFAAEKRYEIKKATWWLKVCEWFIDKYSLFETTLFIIFSITIVFLCSSYSCKCSFFEFIRWLLLCREFKIVLSYYLVFKIILVIIVNLIIGRQEKKLSSIKREKEKVDSGYYGNLKAINNSSFFEPISTPGAGARKK